MNHVRFLPASCAVLCVACAGTDAAPGNTKELGYLQCVDRGLARLVAMGPNLVEGFGRDVDHDGLITGMLPGVGNLIVEGVAGDLLIDGLGGGFCYLAGAAGTAESAHRRAASLSLRTHLSLIAGPSQNDNIIETEAGFAAADQRFIDQPYLVNLDQSFGSLAGMPFGIVRQIGRNFEDNGFLFGLVELVPNTLIATVAEVGGGLAKFGTLIAGQGSTAESIDRWQRDLEANNHLVTGGAGGRTVAPDQDD